MATKFPGRIRIQNYLRVGIHTDPANCTCISVLLGNLGHPVVSAGLLVLYLDTK
jgi:hypothetical protein